jgi:FAD/FMN-containing dehydrogenase/Fe-S oxidoreductase
MKKEDIKKLERKLKNTINGEIRFDLGDRALYATDSSNYRQIPIGVVVPKTIEDIVKTIDVCREFDAPILNRGGGTSLAGQCCNEAVVIDSSKYVNNILHIDPEKKEAIVEPGVVLDTLREEVKKYNLTYGPDPSTHSHCTFGGMIGNNSCGVHSVMAGKTDANIIELDIVTYDGLRITVGQTPEENLQRTISEGGKKGEIYQKLKKFRDRYSTLIELKYPHIPRRVSGYSLPWLLPKNGFNVAKALVGSESTLVTVLKAKIRLVYWPPVRSLVVLGYHDIYAAADHVPEVMKFSPMGLEGIDDRLVDDMKKKHKHPENTKLLPEGSGWLLVEFGGASKEESDGKARKLMDHLKSQPNAPFMKLYDDKEVEETIWKVREAGLGATARVPLEKDTWEGWEDSAVPPEKLGDYLRELRKLLDKYGYQCPFYGHFGQGCLHTRIDFDLFTSHGIKEYRSFIGEASDLVVSLGGSFSGEHGDGQSRGDLLPKIFGDELMQAFREFKSIWDPQWKMNPGKKIDAYSPTSNLRFGPHYEPPILKTHFHFHGDDRGSFARATERCVGVGTCRRLNEGTMCPSYMVTKEEKHSTRGRAHLLFEMLRGEFKRRNVWKNDAVREALDLCLSCKGCKGECPMNVDMATYKAEFLSHYYAWRLRPRSAYAFGLIYWWARLGSTMPRVVNFFTHTAGFAAISKWLAGMSQKREVPKFAPITFKEWFFKEKGYQKKSDKKVILWADTFNNHFHADIATAAVKVLEHLGFEVIVPEPSLCCGRPLYDYGMLDLAKHLLKRILKKMKKEIEEGIPIIGLEPSCAAVFRDELADLFPADVDAMRLHGQVYLLAEFIQSYAQDYPFKHIKKKAIVHGHCHQKSILSFNHDKELLKRLGLDFQVLDSGCCGMAGSFGFEDKHYDISLKRNLFGRS